MWLCVVFFFFKEKTDYEVGISDCSSDVGSSDLPGIINSVLKDAPHSARLVVVGVCMGDDTINPFFGISKELNVQFCLGYDPMEFNESLRAIAEGDIDVTPTITGEVPLEGVADAFEALGNPDAHCKILVTP